MVQLAAAQQAPRALPVTRLGQALPLSRATYYRWRAAEPVREQEPELRAQIHQIALAMPAYGYRRITVELQRRGLRVNHKRVVRLRRKDNLLCLRKEGFVRTTNSRHDSGVYPNLLPTLVVNGLDQLWVADIPDVRLQHEFIYLAVLLDAYSRRCMGWALDRSLEAELALAALRMALATRPIPRG
jgi:putative transposase